MIGRMRVSGFTAFLAALGLAGVIWMIVDVVRLGAGEVPGSTWACGVLGAIVAATALYRELGGTPLLAADPAHQSQAQQFEDQQRRDGLR